MQKTLDRFLLAQENDFQTALFEIRSGKKRSHWMWYIFPQITGLGSSQTAEFYGIKDYNEAKAYLDHPVLGDRLREISFELLKLQNVDAIQVFGYPDNLKLKSCMTLFSAVAESDKSVFSQVLVKYFEGESDIRTLNLINLS